MYDIGDGPALPILVDDFRHASGVSSYFLTHLHADHTRGISKNWNNGIIYCSEVTMRLFKHKFKEMSISSRVLRSLELGVPHAVQLSHSMPATVTLVDANHCPGAVMVVLEVQGRCVLHTGDFRWQANMAQLPCLMGKNIHTVFLDCTYAKPQFLFPPREAAAAQIVSLARKHSDHVIYIAVDTLGKEELLVALAQALDEKIFVSRDRFLRMSLCDFNMDLFTTIVEKTRIRTMDRRLLTRQFIQSQQQALACVGIVPTGWSLEQMGQPASSEAQTLFYTVPYSLHSSYNELLDCVQQIRPIQIVPTSDNEAGGLESCSALCRHALGSETVVQVAALDSIIRSNIGAKTDLGKRNASGLYELNQSCKRRGAADIGAIAETPSPKHTPQRQLLGSPRQCTSVAELPSAISAEDSIEIESSIHAPLDLVVELSASAQWIACKNRCGVAEVAKSALYHESGCRYEQYIYNSYLLPEKLMVVSPTTAKMSLYPTATSGVVVRVKSSTLTTWKRTLHADKITCSSKAA
jgi:DNA cross-link repair 1B protein